MTDQMKAIRPPARNVNERRALPIEDLPQSLPDVRRPVVDTTTPLPAPAVVPGEEPVIFTRGPARRPVPRVADPLLQWATGLHTKERRIYAGWLVEAGKVEALDLAMNDAGYHQVTIKHGSGNLVNHWAVETANLFVVAEGVQSMGEMQHTQDRYGIAFGWRMLDTGRQQSVLRARVFLRELLSVGYAQPLLMTAKSTLTGDVIAALSAQYAVLDAVDSFRADDGKAALNAPFYACSLPIGPGAEVARGTGTQTRAIVPPIANIPNPVTKEYVRSHWIKREWVSLIEGMLDDTIRWSVTASQLISAGEEVQASASYEEPAL